MLWFSWVIRLSQYWFPISFCPEGQTGSCREIWEDMRFNLDAWGRKPVKHLTPGQYLTENLTLFLGLNQKNSVNCQKTLQVLLFNSEHTCVLSISVGKGSPHPISCLFFTAGHSRLHQAVGYSMIHQSLSLKTTKGKSLLQQFCISHISSRAVANFTLMGERIQCQCWVKTSLNCPWLLWETGKWFKSWFDLVND